MARRQDELVAAIRARRRELRQEIDAFLALEPLKTQIRDHPGPWLLGGVLAGAMASRFLIAPLWKQRGQLARNWVRSRLKDAVLALAAASVHMASSASSVPPPVPDPSPPGTAGVLRRAPRRKRAAAAGY